MSRRATSQLTGMTAFTRSRARVHPSRAADDAFADIAGYEAVKQEISEVVEFLRDPAPFSTIGARIPKGILLVGPPAPVRRCSPGPSPARRACRSCRSRVGVP